MRVALQNQRDGLLAFARVLDDKLAAIARSDGFEIFTHAGRITSAVAKEAVHVVVA